jgi:hypothetical protein
MTFIFGFEETAMRRLLVVFYTVILYHKHGSHGIS